MHGELSYTHKWSDNHLLDITGSYNHWGGPNWRSYNQEITYPDRKRTDIRNRTWTWG